jgi:hypothetical protein
VRVTAGRGKTLIESGIDGRQGEDRVPGVDARGAAGVEVGFRVTRRRRGWGEERRCRGGGGGGAAQVVCVREEGDARRGEID